MEGKESIEEEENAKQLQSSLQQVAKFFKKSDPFVQKIDDANLSQMIEPVSAQSQRALMWMLFERISSKTRPVLNELS